MSSQTGTRRRRYGWWILFVAFVVVPLVEIYVIIQVGQVVGAGWTIALLVADSLLGSWLIKREGRKAWAALRVALGEGRMPDRELADGMLILVGGTLMLSPGFVLDILGALFILPFTRPLGRHLLARLVSRRLAPEGAGLDGWRSRGHHADRASTEHGRRRTARPGSGEVVQGEVVD